MKKVIIFSLAAAAVLTACNNDEIPGASLATKGFPMSDFQFSVETPLQTRSNAEGLIGADASAVLNPWSNDDRLRLFVTDYEQAKQGTFTKYEGAVALNRELAYNSTLKGWGYSDGSDPVTLSNVKARLYAWSPSQTTAASPYYNGDATLNPNACPIVFNTPNKVDFLYGTHRNTKDGTTNLPGDNIADDGGSSHVNGMPYDYVDNENTKVRIYMKHAQAYVQVNLLKEAVDPKEKYSGAGVVTAVEIMRLKRTVNAYNKPVLEPADDPKMPSKGTVNITENASIRDNITVTDYSILTMTDFFTGGASFTLNPTVLSGTPTWTKGFSVVCPMEADEVRGFHIQVDGKDFYVDACQVNADNTPRDMEWKAGFKYIYNLILTGKGLNLVPDPEDPDGDGDVDGDGIADFVVVKPWNAGAEIDKDF